MVKITEPMKDIVIQTTIAVQMHMHIRVHAHTNTYTYTQEMKVQNIRREKIQAQGMASETA